MKNLTLSILEFCAETGRDRAAVTKGLKAQGVTIENRAEYRIGVLVRACLNDGKEARARLTTAQAEIEELELAKLRGEIVTVSEMNGLWSSLLGPIRDAITNMPQTAAAKCNPTDPTLAMGELTAAVNHLLRGLREDLIPSVMENAVKETNERKDQTQEGGEESKAVVPEKPKRKAGVGHRKRGKRGR